MSHQSQWRCFTQRFWGESLDRCQCHCSAGTFAHRGKDCGGEDDSICPPQRGSSCEGDGRLCFPVSQLIVPIQRIIEEAHAWSRLWHKNILPLIGIATTFDYAVSFISPWMDNGNAYDYVQNHAIDPRPLVSNGIRSVRFIQIASYAASGYIKWSELPPQP